MRRWLVLTTTGLFIVACLAGASLRPSDDLPPFDPVQEQGDVKVTLLQVSRVTSFSTQYVAQELADRPRAIPGVKVVYLVERLGADPQGLNEGGIQCLVAGKPVKTAAGVTGGGESVSERASGARTISGFELPSRAVPERAILRTEYLRGIALNDERVDLRIKVGFNNLQTFTFESVPLVSSGR